MKKLMIIDGTLKAGGAERVISILSQMLCEQYDIEIVLHYDAPIWYSIPENVKITVIEKECLGKNNLQKLKWLRKYIKSNAQVVLSFLAPINIFTLVSTLGLKTPVIVADRNDPRFVPGNTVIRKLRDFMYNFARHIVVQNENNKKYFSKSIRKKSSIIFNPVDFEDYLGCALTAEKTEKIACVGRLIEQKNNKMLLQAFANINEEFPNHKLVFYGDGNMHKALEQESSDLKIGEKVIFAGKVKNVIDNIKDAQLYVMTSNYEGMPNALLEAMCAGLPVISTKVSGAVDVIEHEKNGFLVEVNDADALTEAMRKFLGNKEYATECAKNAVKVSKLLDKEEIVQQWINLIEKVVR